MSLYHFGGLFEEIHELLIEYGNFEIADVTRGSVIRREKQSRKFVLGYIFILPAFFTGYFCKTFSFYTFSTRKKSILKYSKKVYCFREENTLRQICLVLDSTLGRILLYSFNICFCFVVLFHVHECL